jgi:hypothetical protein
MPRNIILKSAEKRPGVGELEIDGKIILDGIPLTMLIME